ncbi:regulator of G-protein signaling 22 isoform X2 [Hyla sarda]|uniref:regulator of G-protein signaling 22 isoform X2 n=1 Tax=Hyla sarda TaxID=327740 RepID=UPI0024C392AC|nr:regulator of G-protein signaling 22 isoform X2 [Hyla sarda]
MPGDPGSSLETGTGPPDITEDVFEDFLVTDNLLVDYFNEFLRLPTFTEAIKFNKIYGVFEVISNVPDHLEEHIKKVLHDHQSPNPIYNASRSVTGQSLKKYSLIDIKIDNNYNVMCLNREQGVEWIKKERLPAFLKSDCYFEYRLAKLLSQVRVNNAGVSLEIDPHYQPWTLKRVIAASPSPTTENEETMKRFFVTLGQIYTCVLQASLTQTKEWFTIAKQSATIDTTNSVSGLMTWGDDRSQVLQSISSHQKPKLLDSNKNFGKSQRDSKKTQDTWEKEEYPVSIAPSPTPSPIRLYVEQKQDQKPEDTNPVFPTMDDFAFYYVDRVVNSVVSKMNGNIMKKSVDKVDIFDLSQVTIQKVASTRASSISSEVSIEEELDVSDLDDDEQDSLNDSHYKQEYSQIRSHKEFEKFKSFIKGTSGEKLFLLWMEIERLKSINDIKRKQSHLNKMKKLYMMVTGDQYLQAEVLARLNLLDTNQWHENHLLSVQAEIAKPLLLYWGPRFCLSSSVQANKVGADLRVRYDRQLRPKRDADPFAQTITLLPLRPKSCMPRIATTSSPVNENSQAYPKIIKSASSPRLSGSLISAKLSQRKRQIRSLPASAPLNRSQNRPKSSRPATAHTTVFKGKARLESCRSGMEEDALSSADTSYGVLKSSKIEKMLQALNLDSRAGYFFTTFCEQSGNKLWENGVHFWFDLQSYHHLFYQETLQPFKLRRQSQLIFGTYLAPSASMDIGVEQTIRKEIYQKLDPPFEDLFDSAEEYVLTILLSAWKQMTELDRQAYGKVELVEESRQLESANYQKLQALQREKASKKDEDQASKYIFVPPPDIPKEPNLWDLVPEEYRNYNLETLLRHRMELEHFRAFLEEHFASMDLKCWVDLEHLRRASHKKKEERLETSKDIKNKYLNKKYFFGPNSPATRDQQEQVMMLAGGWGKILHDRLPPTVVTEIQKYVRMRIEKKWLPMFLSTEEFRERQKRKSQMKDVAEDVIFQTNKKKLGVWKQLDSKWISSSKEIIVFRKALLNPITASQFQRFIALKGDFYENGLLFWQEVQKYKDLCHSHCDESTIQNKITAIINCFINSSIPPALQIDIPPEQAEKIIERRRDLGPYVFREAQMTIFSILFKFWPQFCEFRNRLTDEKIVPLLERKKAKRAEQMKQKVKEQEKLANQQQEGSKRKSTFSDIYNDNDSIYSEESFSGRNTIGRSRNVSWSYSKYLEALEQERMLLKIQQDLEKKTESSVMSDDSLLSVRTDETKRTGKTVGSSHQSGQAQRLLSATRR